MSLDWVEGRYVVFMGKGTGVFQVKSGLWGCTGLLNISCLSLGRCAGICFYGYMLSKYDTIQTFTSLSFCI